MSETRQFGAFGERIARLALEAAGMQFRAANWRCARGEIDLVMEDEGTWVFVEVKTRRSHAAVSPEAAITPRKAARLIELAQTYLLEHNMDDVAWRIDVYAIEVDAAGKLRRQAPLSRHYRL